MMWGSRLSQSMEAQNRKGLPEAVMSFIDDYSLKLIADQRQRELVAQAAEERLAAIARGNRSASWRRLLGNWLRTPTRRADSVSSSPGLTAVSSGAGDSCTAVAR
jgi:hypothetical protein